MNNSKHPLPAKYNIQKSKINEKFLQDLYSYFNFQYINFNDKNIADHNIFNFLNENKFITYQFSTKSNNNEIQHNIVFCYENSCFIFECINKDIILQKIKDTNSTFLDVDSFQNEEIAGFYESFICREIENNQFIKYTIKPLIAYIIQRNYYPSDFFKDHDFFTFNKKIQFEIDDFINLRSISTSLSLLKISLYKPTLQVFAVKHFCNYEQYKKELKFCNNNSHQVFVPYYGIIKNEKAIVYKYMSNGSLYSYYSNNKDSISKIFPYNAINRISQGIEYLQSRNLIHRDLQPGNILVDNDHRVYISDFETIREVNHSDKKDEEFTQDIGSVKYDSPEQYSNKVVSFETDIYSFGLLMYFLFEKKDMFNSDLNISEIHKRKEEGLILEINIDNTIKTDNTNNNIIKNLCKCCLNPDPKKRPTILQIQKAIFSEIEKPLLILEKHFFMIDFIEAIEFALNRKDLSKLINEMNNHKYYWIFMLYYLIWGLKSPNLYLFLGYYFLYKDEFLRDEHKDKFKIPREINKILYYFQEAAKINNSEAYLQLGNLYYYGKYITRDECKAIKNYKLAADLGNSDAMIQLGEMYFDEKFEQKDDSIALKYYELAAEKLNANALLKLGNLYYEGIKVKQNYSKALEYFQNASILHNSEALVQLGNIYYYGHGVKKSFFRAKEYYEMATKFNNNTAYLKLGNLYNDGNGVEIDISKSIKYYMLSYRLHNETNLTILTDNNSICSYALSCNNLGLIYILEKNYLNTDLALHFLKKAAAGDEYSFGQNNFALCKELICREKDDIEHYYMKSSNQKFALASFNLGRIKETNDKKIDDSIEFYIQASDNENEPLVLKNQKIHDERFELSKTFIICFTNLKLTHFFMTKAQNEQTESNQENIKKFFKRSFSNLMARYQHKLRFVSYNNIYSYIINYFLDFPLFNITKNNDYSNQMNKSIKMDLSMNENKSCIDEMKKIECINPHSSSEKRKQTETLIEELDDLDDLFELAMKNRPLFVETLSFIISKMSEHLYTSPYSILFGRIRIHHSTEQNNIDQAFLDGFKI